MHSADAETIVPAGAFGRRYENQHLDFLPCRCTGRVRHLWLLERTHGRGRHGNDPTASQYRTGAASWTGSCGRKSRRGTAFRGYQRRS